MHDRRLTLGLIVGGAVGGLAACAGAPAPMRGPQGRRGGWARGPALPLPMQEIYPVRWGGGIVQAGGFVPEGGSIRAADEAFVLDARGGWQPLPPLPQARHHPYLAVLADIVHVIGGFAFSADSPWQNRAEVWRLVPGAGWRPAPPLPFPLAETVGGSEQGQIVLATGRRTGPGANAQYDDQADTGATLVFDGARWTERRPAPTPRNSAAGGFVGGRLHVVGGRSGDRATRRNHVEHEAYDAEADRWETLAPLPAPRSGHAGAVVGGRLHMLGGESFGPSGRVYPEHWAWDPATDRWEEQPPMPEGRHGLGLVELGGRLYAIGGASEVGARGTSARVDVYA